MSTSFQTRRSPLGRQSKTCRKRTRTGSPSTPSSCRTPPGRRARWCAALLRLGPHREIRDPGASRGEGPDLPVEAGDPPWVLVLEVAGVGPPDDHRRNQVLARAERGGDVELLREPGVPPEAHRLAVHADVVDALGTAEVEHRPTTLEGRAKAEAAPVDARGVVPGDPRRRAGRGHLDVGAVRPVESLDGPVPGHPPPSAGRPSPAPGCASPAPERPSPSPGPRSEPTDGRRLRPPEGGGWDAPRLRSPRPSATLRGDALLPPASHRPGRGG